MKEWKSVAIKRVGKKDRERKVLFGLVEYYIRTGKPVGSNALKEAGFEDLSSATIRNYFADLEELGYLTQAHSSGGRIPTHLAFKVYAESFLSHEKHQFEENPFSSLLQFDSHEIALLIQKAAELLSQKSRCAVFISAPRFDHDFVINIKLISLDAFRCLCVLITDFGMIQTEILHLHEKLSSFAIKRIESYFLWRLTKNKKPENLKPEEESIGQTIYNELMLRYIVGYSNFVDQDIYRTGFSNLLIYPDFQDTQSLSAGLSLFENVQGMRQLLKENMELDRLSFWIGEDLNKYGAYSNCSILAMPYYINHKPVGAVGLMGPVRLPYPILFPMLRMFSESVSEILTRNIYKFKITFRQPKRGESSYLQKEDHRLIGQSYLILLEDKRISKGLSLNKLDNSAAPKAPGLNDRK